MKNRGLRRLKRAFPNLAPVAGLFLVIFGIIGLLFVQKPLQESQENRPDAAVAVGFVEVSSISTPSATFQVKKGESVDFEIGIISKDLTKNNFSGVASVDLVFDIVTDTANTVEVTAALPGFNEKSTEIESTDYGFLVAVKMVANTSEIDLQFPVRIKVLTVSVIPEKSGSVKLMFDQTLSRVIASDTDQDILTIPKSITYQIQMPVDPVVPPFNPPLNSKTCNQNCTKNADCDLGLSCITNKCRNPKNSPSLTCAAPSASQTTAQIASCNQSCQKNADCAVNYRCFNSSGGLRCRLATNPSSSSCAPYTEKTVTVEYPEKGGYTDDGPDIEPSADPDDSKSEVIGDTEPSPSLFPTPTPEEEAASRLASEKTAFDTLMNLFKDGQFALPVIVLLAGLVILILSLIFHLLKSAFKRRPPKSEPATIKSAPPTSNQVLKEENVPPPVRRPIPPPPPQRPQAGLEHPPQLNRTALFTGSSSMIDRMKSKGIQVPGNDDVSEN